MRPVSGEFLRTLRGSHKISLQAFAVEIGQTGVNPVGTEIPILGGSIEQDANAAIRSMLSLETFYKFPTRATDLLLPYGNYELFLRAGLQYNSGSFEYVSMGYYRIWDVVQDEATDGALSITGQDRMAGLIDGDLTSPTQFLPTQTYGNVVEQLVTQIYPWAVIQWDDSTDDDLLGVSLIVTEESGNRYSFLNNLITGVGKIWYWDHRGILVIKDLPDNEATWTVDAGPGGVLVRHSRETSREGVYNAVKVTGEALDTEVPASGFAYDNNPDSPTYWNGPFGKVPRFYSSPFVTTDIQAEVAAINLLKKNLGLPYSVEFDLIPNPALEPYDCVDVVGKNGVTETHVIESLSFPLSVEGSQTARTREQTVVVIG